MDTGAGFGSALGLYISVLRFLPFQHSKIMLSMRCHLIAFSSHTEFISNHKVGCTHTMHQLLAVWNTSFGPRASYTLNDNSFCNPNSNYSPPLAGLVFVFSVLVHMYMTNWSNLQWNATPCEFCVEFRRICSPALSLNCPKVLRRGSGVGQGWRFKASLRL